ncbi:MAG: hypothetical protein C0402_13525 [Thermodesulfovibrio sp.]|nr:hypothetical protein [Thermodesulfovibrio sp.]
MSDIPDVREVSTGRGHCLAIELQPSASSITRTDRQEIPFERAILKIQNVCDAEVEKVVLHATLGQEGGTVQDVSSSFALSTPFVIPPGGTATWDVYDQLLPAHPGAASKIHMFGYRAVLNWVFELAVWAEYFDPSNMSLPAQTSASRWTLRWSASESSPGAIGLSISGVKD